MNSWAQSSLGNKECGPSPVILNGIGVDISQEALEVASENAQQCGFHAYDGASKSVTIASRA